MRRLTRRLVATVVLGTLAMAPLAACGDAEEISPLPARAASQPAAATPGQTPSIAAPSASATTSPSTKEQRPPSSPKATRTRGAQPTAAATSYASACMGTIRYEIDVPNTELALIKRLCFRAGAVLRLQNIGPGLVSAEPESLHTYNYEAGVVDVGFNRPGTVTVNITKEEQTYLITVVVIA